MEADPLRVRCFPMRLATLALFLVGCSSRPTPHVELPSPLPLPTVTPAREAKVDPTAARLSFHGNGDWAASFAHEKTFVSVAAPAGPSVVFEWHVGNGHRMRDLPAEEDYSANYVGRIELVLHAGDQTARIDFGERSGAVDPLDSTYCRERGFRLPKGSTWSIPKAPGVGSSFSVAMTQGSSDFLLVQDNAVVRVLHRETSDGRCDDAKQGPLSICEGGGYEIAAEVRTVPGTTTFENISTSDAPFECTQVAPYGAVLLPPN